jgi:hypothetical protein
VPNLLITSYPLVMVPTSAVPPTPSLRNIRFVAESGHGPDNIRCTVRYLRMRMTIGAVFAAAFNISGAAQEFIAQSGAPAAAFPKPDRPVANIVSPIWHDEKERDEAGEPSQLVRSAGGRDHWRASDAHGWRHPQRTSG